MATGSQPREFESDVEKESVLLCSEKLVDLLSMRKKQYYAALVALINRTKETISWLEKHFSRHINTFAFGRTHVFRKRKKEMANSEYEGFDPVDPSTWDLQGIVSDWNATYKPKGYDGLVLLCVVTKQCVPRQAKKGRFCYDHQGYSFALEQGLKQHFLFAEGECRLLNDLMPVNHFRGGTAVGYVLFIAYMYDASGLNNTPHCVPFIRNERAVGQASQNNNFDSK